MEKQLENPTQNQDKPTGKPNSKSIKTHRVMQPKTPNLLPLLLSSLPFLPPDLPLLSSVGGGRWRVVSWGWEAKVRWWRREGGAKERGRAKSRRRPNWWRVKVAAAASWIGSHNGLGEAVVRERVREREERMRELKR